MTFFNFLQILQATKSQFFENGKLEKNNLKTKELVSIQS